MTLAGIATFALAACIVIGVSMLLAFAFMPGKTEAQRVASALVLNVLAAAAAACAFVVIGAAFASAAVGEKP